MNEKLLEALMEEYNRLKEILESSPIESDNWKMADQKMHDLMKTMNEFNKAETEYFTKQDVLEAEKKHNEKMLEIEKEKLAQHAKIEESRRQGEIALEKEKKKINWERLAFELALVLVPLGVTIASRRQERHEMYDFETHDRLTSTVGRQFRLLDLYKKK